MNNIIFVFGSNEAGIHGVGAARHASIHHGAKMRQGSGRQGTSYAIPTKSWNVYTSLPIHEIRENVEDFMQYARDNPELTFKVTKVGTGEAGYINYDMASLFIDAPDNCYFDEEWKQYLGEDKNYWGRFDD